MIQCVYQSQLDDATVDPRLPRRAGGSFMRANACQYSGKCQGNWRTFDSAPG